MMSRKSGDSSPSPPLTQKWLDPTLPEVRLTLTPGEAMQKRLIIIAFTLLIGFSQLYGQDSKGFLVDYRLLATNKTSTMTKELNEAAVAGFRLERAMGGESAYGGSEVVAVMSRNRAAEPKPRFEYRLLATNKTSTMQKELQEAGDIGFEYRDQTVFKTTYGGDEVVVILERDKELPLKRWEYKLLATNRTSTMQKELQEAGTNGFQIVGVTVGKSAFGGKEVISIMRRPVQ